MPNQLKLGIPKGSLEDSTISLFDRAGWKIHKHIRNYFPDIDDSEITARLCRVQEIPHYIQDGVLDLALTGKDWIEEMGVDMESTNSLLSALPTLSIPKYPINLRAGFWLLQVILLTKNRRI